ncbi:MULTISPECIES: hypothetical protein [unclassified Treponema]|uniref:DUF7668 domain-containing protein n=1 Tax=unclassified Treponema TaxID=2638727 RepID=UPI0020A33AAA|nr:MULTISPECIES: hypothetical protein [unclassified Treponema]UTC66576.1 hypothetical protein E4O06_11540 [Treponema sp. OMZ 789]UTC69309.1 hypothetical protein E4O01_11680 [Treponema sp. OMZ 790]UTC72023.1 hypothetical protein E4O02_11775 [Treponema sp. OMZ 791]
MKLQLTYFESIIKEIVYNISVNNYEAVKLNSQNGRVDIDDLRRIITKYGCIIVPLPDEAFTKAEIYDVKDENRLDVYIPLWTKEEGRSDLTLSVSCYITNETAKVEINDLRVL